MFSIDEGTRVTFPLNRNAGLILIDIDATYINRMVAVNMLREILLARFEKRCASLGRYTVELEEEDLNKFIDHVQDFFLINAENFTYAKGVEDHGSDIVVLIT